MHAWDSVDRNPSDLLKEIGEVAFHLLSWALVSSWPVPLAAPALAVWLAGGNLWLWPRRSASFVLTSLCPGQASPYSPEAPRLLCPLQGDSWDKEEFGVWDPPPSPSLLPSPTFPQLLHSLGPLEKGRRQNAIKAAFSEPLAFKVPLWGGWIQSTSKKKESFFMQTRSGWL